MAKFFALLLPLFALMTATSGLSLDALLRTLEKENPNENVKEITLKEYLDALPMPDPAYRPLSKRNEIVPCSSVCGAPPSANHDGQTCKTSKWVPNYQAKEDCECLIGYRCCPDTCPTLDANICWANDNKGLKYGIEEVDCCGCEVMKCLDCEAPASQVAICPNTRPADCFTYTAQSTFADKTACYQPTCTELPSDAEDEECDARCMKEDSELSACMFSYTTCVPKTIIDDCPLNDVADNTPDLSLSCYSSPKKVVDDAGGFYYKDSSCVACHKWNFEKISCDAKNAAAAAEDCHQNGESELDKKCWTPKITQDNCKCDLAECTSSHDEVELKFGENEVCAKDHVKISGTSICAVARDLCKPCSDPVPIAPEDCSFGKVLKSRDVNGCPNIVCQKATYAGVPSECKSGQFTYNEDSNQFECKATIG